MSTHDYTDPATCPCRPLSLAGLWVHRDERVPERTALFIDPAGPAFVVPTPNHVPGTILPIGSDNARLTIEPTEAGDDTVHVWAHVDGTEYGAQAWSPDYLRRAAADLLARAELIDRTRR